MRKNHPLVKKNLDLATFAKLNHILTNPQGDLIGVVDQALKRQGLKRKVVAGVNTFQIMGKLVAESDCCATLPRSMAIDQARSTGLNLFAPPVELPPIKLIMIWHQRIHTSPLHQWIRKKMQRILKEELAETTELTTQ